MRHRTVRRTAGLLVAALVCALSVGMGTALAQELNSPEQGGLTCPSVGEPEPGQVISVETDEEGTTAVVDFSGSLDDESIDDGDGAAGDEAGMTGLPVSTSSFAIVGMLDPFVVDPSEGCTADDGKLDYDIRVVAKVIANTYNVADVLPTDPPVGITKISNLKYVGNSKPVVKGYIASGVLDKVTSKTVVTLEADAEVTKDGKVATVKVSIKLSFEKPSADEKTWKYGHEVTQIKK